MFAAIFSI